MERVQPNWHRMLTGRDIGNRAVVQVFEGTPGIDVKKVYNFPLADHTNASMTDTFHRLKLSSLDTA